MISSTLGMAHLTAALLALALGGVVVLERKGTETHRMMGMGYALAMLVVNVTATRFFTRQSTALRVP